MSTFSSEANSPHQTLKLMYALSLSSEANSPQEAHTASGRRPSSPAASCQSHTSCAPETLVSRSLCLRSFAIWKTKPDHLRGKDPPSRPSSPASSRPCLPSWSSYFPCCCCRCPLCRPYHSYHPCQPCLPCRPYHLFPCHLKSSQC